MRLIAATVVGVAGQFGCTQAPTPTGQHSHLDRHEGAHAEMHEAVHAFLHDRAAEMDQIAPDRRTELDTLAGFIAEDLSDGESRVVAVCTHNSRRSHMSQLWLAAAMAHEGVGGVITHSAGTEATAFNPNAIEAMRRAGWEILVFNPETNPIYQSSFGTAPTAVWSFSKALGHPSLPEEDFIAVMVCDDANEACPFVPGAAERIPITYADPKASDGTEREAETYDERCAQIAREMLHVARAVSKALAK